MNKLLTSTDDEHERSFVRNQAKKDSEVKSDQAAAECAHLYMRFKTRELFGFVID